MIFCSNWQPGHTYHRIGASADIDRNAEVFGNPGDFVSRQTYQVDRLTAIMRRYGGNRFPEPTIHYGFGGR